MKKRITPICRHTWMRMRYWRKALPDFEAIDELAFCVHCGIPMNSESQRYREVAQAHQKVIDDEINARLGRFEVGDEPVWV